jgi:hypothetical protein
LALRVSHKLNVRKSLIIMGRRMLRCILKLQGGEKLMVDLPTHYAL